MPTEIFDYKLLRHIQSGDGIFDIILLTLEKKFSDKNLEFINSEKDGAK